MELAVDNHSCVCRATKGEDLFVGSFLWYNTIEVRAVKSA